MATRRGAAAQNPNSTHLTGDVSVPDSIAAMLGQELRSSTLDRLLDEEEEVSATVHALHYCKGDECESDEDETPSTMYS